jgi:16S rRNA processing protein RimM
VAIARIARPRGNRGELVAIPLSSRPERYQVLQRVYLSGPEGVLNGGVPYEVESAREYRDRLVLKLAGVDSISQAESLRGAEVCIPRSERFELPPDEYYLSDIVGCDVISSSSGEPIGQVRNWQDYEGNVLLEVVVAQTGEEVLIPFARSICTGIDTKSKRILVSLPEGLRELNRS